MSFAPYFYDTYVPPPKPKLNGGLYTGEPFHKNAPWGNVPVTPDIEYMINTNLRSANPPIEALFQYPGTTRIGNNHQSYHGLARPKTHNFTCAPCIKSKSCYTKQGQPTQCD